MAQEMEIGVVAEGVETLEQAELLHGLGCGLAQGFLFGHPEPEPRAAAEVWGGRGVAS